METVKRRVNCKIEQKIENPTINPTDSEGSCGYISNFYLFIELVGIMCYMDMKAKMFQMATLEGEANTARSKKQ